MNYRLKKAYATLGVVAMFGISLVGCGNRNTVVESTEEKTTMSDSEISHSQEEKVQNNDLFSDRDLQTEFDLENAIAISLEDTVTISEEGTYILSGSLNDGQIIVDAEDKKVQLILNGVNITSKDSACIYVKAADKVFVSLMDGTENSLTTTDEFVADGDIKVDGVIFAKADLTLNGKGSLEIVSEGGNGVVCKDELVITGGSYDVQAASHAIEVNDRVSIAAGTFNLVAGKDGIQCDNDKDEELGLIYVEDGTFFIEAESDGMHASSRLQIDGGNISVKKSEEGLEGSSVIINEGTIDICSSDDGINAAGGTENKIQINGGNIKVNASGDGVDSNGTIEITGGYTLVSGPTDNGNSAIDFEYDCVLTGGVLIATGSSGMVEQISQESTQGSMTIGLSSFTDEEFSITDSAGNIILSAVPEKSYNCIIVSSPEFVVGESYTLTAGQETSEITFSELVYSDVSGGFGPGGMQGPGGFKPGDMQCPGGKPGFDDMPNGEMPDFENMPQPDDMQMKKSSIRGK